MPFLCHFYAISMQFNAISNMWKMSFVEKSHAAILNKSASIKVDLLRWIRPVESTRVAAETMWIRHCFSQTNLLENGFQTNKRHQPTLKSKPATQKIQKLLIFIWCCVWISRNHLCRLALSGKDGRHFDRQCKGIPGILQLGDNIFHQILSNCDKIFVWWFFWVWFGFHFSSSSSSSSLTFDNNDNDHFCWFFRLVYCSKLKCMQLHLEGKAAGTDPVRVSVFRWANRLPSGKLKKKMPSGVTQRQTSRDCETRIHALAARLRNFSRRGWKSTKKKNK